MIDLPMPNPALWPNGRANRFVHAREVKKHRAWARLATLADNTRPPVVGRLIVTVYPRWKGPPPDRDNCVAACKSYIDGIADAYRANDRDWPEPRIIIAERTKTGGMSICIEPPACGGSAT